MLGTLQRQCEKLKMRIIALGTPLSPPGCVHTHKLRQILFDYSEIATSLGYSTSQEKNLFKCAIYIYFKLLGLHFQIKNLCDLYKASTYVDKYMNHYFENDARLFWSHCKPGDSKGPAHNSCSASVRGWPRWADNIKSATTQAGVDSKTTGILSGSALTTRLSNE